MADEAKVHPLIRLMDAADELLDAEEAYEKVCADRVGSWESFPMHQKVSVATNELKEAAQAHAKYVRSIESSLRASQGGDGGNPVTVPVNSPVAADGRTQTQCSCCGEWINASPLPFYPGALTIEFWRNLLFGRAQGGN